MLFQHGGEFEYEFETSPEHLIVLAAIEIHGDTIVLDELSAYPKSGDRQDLGVRQLLDCRKQLFALARAEGFRRIVVYG